MQRDEQISRLIGDIYDAALDSSLWPRALQGTADFIRGTGAALFGRDLARAFHPFYDIGVSPEYKQLYFERYARLDPLHLAYFCLDVGDVLSNSQVVAHDEFVKSRFYRDWVQPQGFIDNAIAMLDKSPTSFSAIAIFRHERDGLTDDAARNRLRLLIPHFRRAVLIGNVIHDQVAEAVTLADTLDGISAGMFLVDASGRIIHANTAGRAMLLAADVVEAVGGRLAVGGPDQNRALREVLAAAEMGDSALGVNGIALPLTGRHGEPHLVHLLPLTSGARRRTGAAYAAVALLFVHKAAFGAPSAPEAIVKAYKLTPTELRVLLAIVEVGGVPEIAADLGIAETTVKTHLGRLYAKTGVNRQADLVKLVAGFTSPLAG